MPECVEHLSGQRTRKSQPSDDIATGGQQSTAEAAGAVQCDDGCEGSVPVSEQFRKVQDPAGLGAAKGIDGLIRISDDDHVPPSPAITAATALAGIGVLIPSTKTQPIPRRSVVTISGLVSKMRQRWTSSA